MFDQIQDIAEQKDYIISQYKNNSKRRLSSLFKDIRKKQSYSLIGDYPMLAYIISVAKSIGIKFSRKEIIHAFGKSEELKGFRKKTKTDLLTQLEEVE